MKPGDLVQECAGCAYGIVLEVSGASFVKVFWPMNENSWCGWRDIKTLNVISQI